MAENREIITYDALKIFHFILDKGFITSRDLMINFLYSQTGALWILSELNITGIVFRKKGADEYIEEAGAVYPKYYLTEIGKNINNWPSSITVILRKSPVASRVLVEQINYLLEILGERGVKFGRPEGNDGIRKPRVKEFNN